MGDRVSLQVFNQNSRFGLTNFFSCKQFSNLLIKIVNQINIGVVGLAVMGANLALNIESRGFAIAPQQPKNLWMNRHKTKILKPFTP